MGLCATKEVQQESSTELDAKKPQPQNASQEAKGEGKPSGGVEQKQAVDPKEVKLEVVEERRDPVIGGYLRRVPLLRKLSDGERELIGGALIERSFAPGSIVFSQGDEADGFYIIKEGTAVVVQAKENSNEVNELARLGTGDIFGETALLSDSPRGAAVKAGNANLTCFFLSSVKFKALLAGQKINVRFAKRRVAISAEAADEEKSVDEIKRPSNKNVMSMETMQLIRAAIKDNILFQGLAEDVRDKVVAQMYCQTISAGTTAIKEGEIGSNFYVIEKGSFDVSVTDKASQSKRSVAQLGPSQCFGELALMYNAPRAATVTATSESVVWLVDRYTFRRIARGLGEQRLQQYTDFLQGVELLSPLAEYERQKIAEALELISYPAGAVIFRQGDVGDALYIVADGEVVMSKEEGHGKSEVIAASKKGEYFGERALTKNEPRACTVTAFEHTHLLKLDATAFNQLLGPLEEILKKQVESYEKVDDEEIHLDNDIAMTDLQVVGVLGKGSFGTVQLVRHKDNALPYALKSVSKAQIVETRQQGHVMNEKKVMASLKHPFITRLHATYKSSNRLYFLLEPSMGGELFTLLRRVSVFSESTARFYAACVVSAFGYMHSKDMVYRDLKPENLLLDTEGFIKITDFGFAKKIKAKTWTLCGTPEYLAPEIVAGKGHGKGVDWWTLGILIFEMLASYTPFYHEDHMKMYKNISQGRIRFPSHFSKEAKSLIKGLLQIVPTQRLGIIEGGADRIKSHPWFEGFDWQALEQRRMVPPIKPKLKGAFDMANFEECGDLEEYASYVDDGTAWDKDF